MLDPAVELKPSRKLPRRLRVYIDGGILRAVLSPRSSGATWLASAYAVPSACHIGEIAGDPMLFFGEARFEVTSREALKLVELLQLQDKRFVPSSDTGRTE